MLSLLCIQVETTKGWKRKNPSQATLDRSALKWTRERLKKMSEHSSCNNSLFQVRSDSHYWERAAKSKTKNNPCNKIAPMVRALLSSYVRTLFVGVGSETVKTGIQPLWYVQFSLPVPSSFNRLVLHSLGFVSFLLTYSTPNTAAIRT